MALEDIIIGSGPSGIAAAHGRLARGARVRMLDVGVALEPERQALKARMGASEPEAWTADDRAMLTAQMRGHDGGGMRPYGSDFYTRAVIDLIADASALKPSFARGGLSNGWGAAFAPYRAGDIADWPRAAQDLAPHYRAVAAFAPVAAVRDDLADALTLWSPPGDAGLPPSPQARTLLRNLANARARLARRGVAAGQARQAVATGCRRCGMCLYGCPYGLIFNAGEAVSALARNDAFVYEPGVRITRFAEDGDGVAVHGVDMATGAQRTWRGARLFIASGVLPTAHLVLSTLGAPGAALTLRDSQAMLMPMLHAWPAPPAEAMAQAHTLTQAFLECSGPPFDARSAHVQIYTHNAFYLRDLRQRFGARVPDFILRALSRRLLVAQGFLHSDVSGAMSLSLDGSGDAARLRVTPQENAATAPMLAALQHTIARALAGAGVFAMTFQARASAIGESFHCGASLPMRDAPRGLETDTIGRIAGLSRVHVVDASVLPAIPATTITFSVMANAHRIASHAPA
ncbi:MAG: GMC oxidoreductase [Hyphomonadaceae bacterium]|nr:GMC oxidoreductase [Hyphomonadaceae bacterium]